MIELELKREPRDSTDRLDTPCRQVDCPYLGLNELHVTKDAAQRIDNIACIKISRGYLVQHRREQNEVLPADQRHFCIRAPSQRLVQVHSRAQSGKSTSQNDDASLLHLSRPLD